MRIACFEVEEWERAYLSERLDDVQFHEEALTERTAHLAEGAAIISVFIYSEVSAEVMDRLPSLRHIATRSTGFDHIDLAAAEQRGVRVSNVPHYGENTVAEHTFALLLAISRKLLPSVQRVRGGSFDAHGLEGFDLAGKTIGVIGSGHIGLHVVRMANGFHMRVLAYDPFPNPDLQEQEGFRYVGLDELLSQSDVISLHCPYNEHTHHLLNAENLQRVKEGAVLLNTSRGRLVDSDALYKALIDGRIAAAGLDVLEEESSIKEEREILTQEYRASIDLHKMVLEHALIHLPNVLVTPHNAFNSREALIRILDTTLHNISTDGADNLVQGSAE